MAQVCHQETAGAWHLSNCVELDPRVPGIYEDYNNMSGTLMSPAPEPPPPPIQNALAAGPPVPPPPPPPSSELCVAHATNEKHVNPRCPQDNSSSSVKLPQQLTPHPKTQMKRLQWNKIPMTRIISSKSNVWTKVARMFADYDLNYDQMEELFCTGVSSCASGSNGGTPGIREALSPDGGGVSCSEKKTKKPDQINLIDSKRSMNVNIFLRQFRTTDVRLVDWIRSGESQKIGPEILRGLLKILPEPEDIQLLSSFDGDRMQLGSAEKFYLELLSLPDHRLFIDALLMKEEFNQTIDYIKPAIDAIILSAHDIKDSNALHEIIYMVLIAGNFLNSGVYSGNAVGFQLNSLIKLSEIRANKPRMTLLHFVAQEAETRNPAVIDRLKELKYLMEASQYSIESLLIDITNLQDRVRTISNRILKTDCQFQQQMKAFLEMANREMELLDLDTKELEDLRIELSNYFCEDEKNFKLDECIATFNTFSKMFLKALEENKERQQQDLRAEERRRLREEQISSIRRRSLTQNENKDYARSFSDVMNKTSPTDSVESTTLKKSRSAISTSRTMPSFLVQTTDVNSSREGSPARGATTLMRHRKRNSVTNILKCDDDKTTSESESLNEKDLMDYLMKAAVDDADKRQGSAKQRRRSRLSVDILERERAPSPSPLLNVSSPHVTATVEADGNVDNNTENGCGPIGRGTPGKSSCPSRITCSQGHHQKSLLVKENLLRQHSGREATDSPIEEFSPYPSDAETNANEEREHRRLERRRRSRMDSVMGEAEHDSLSIKSDLVASQIGSTDDGSTAGHQSKEKASFSFPPRDNKSQNWNNSWLNGVDLQSQTATARRDTSNIRAFVDQRRHTTEHKRGTIMTSSIQEPALNKNNFDSGSNELMSDEQEDGLVKTNSIPDQMISIGTKPSGSKSENDESSRRERKMGSRLVQDSSIKEILSENEGLEEHSGKWKSGEILRSNSNTLVETQNGAASKDGTCTESRSDADKTTGQLRLTVERNSSNDTTCTDSLRRCGSMVAVDEDETESKSSFKLNYQISSVPDPLTSEKPEERNIEMRKSMIEVFGEREDSKFDLEMENRSVEKKVADAGIDFADTLRGNSKAIERALFRKEKMKRLSQMYSDDSSVSFSKLYNPVDFGLNKFLTRSTKNETNSQPLRKLQSLYSVHQDYSPNRTTSHDRTELRSDTDSIYSGRDEVFESEGFSLSSVSQRASTSSNVESDVRITPLMTRKTCDDAESKTIEMRSSSNHNIKQHLHAENNATSPTIQFARTSIGSLVSNNRSVRPTPSKTTEKKISEVCRRVGLGKNVRGLSNTRENHPTKSQDPSSFIYRDLQKSAVNSTRAIVKPASRVSTPAFRKQGTISAKQQTKPVSTVRSGKGNGLISQMPRTGKILPGKVGNDLLTRDHHSTLLENIPSTVHQQQLRSVELARHKIGTGTAKKAAENKTEDLQIPNSTTNVITTTARPSINSAFVRGADGRATMQADVLRENKKAAVESRKRRETPASVPPRGTSSLLPATNPSNSQPSQQSNVTNSGRLGLTAVEVTPLETVDTTRETREISLIKILLSYKTTEKLKIHSTSPKTDQRHLVKKTNPDVEARRMAVKDKTISNPPPSRKTSASNSPSVHFSGK